MHMLADDCMQMLSVHAHKQACKGIATLQLYVLGYCSRNWQLLSYTLKSFGVSKFTFTGKMMHDGSVLIIQRKILHVLQVFVAARS